jgi:hypothetical protein
MSNRLAITLLIYGIVQAVIFGAGLFTLFWSPLKSDPGILIPTMIAFGLALAVPVALTLAVLLLAKPQRGAAT